MASKKTAVVSRSKFIILKTTGQIEPPLHLYAGVGAGPRAAFVHEMRHLFSHTEINPNVFKFKFNSICIQV